MKSFRGHAILWFDDNEYVREHIHSWIFLINYTYLIQSTFRRDPRTTLYKMSNYFTLLWELIGPLFRVSG